MKFGLSARQYELICSCIKGFPEIERVTVFGSRALGNWKPASDLDLLLIGSDVNQSTVVRLRGQLAEDAPLPFHFDILSENDLSPELTDHIQTYGIPFWPSA